MLGNLSSTNLSANKQDVPSAAKLTEIQQLFNQIASKLEARDSKVLGISALTG